MEDNSLRNINMQLKNQKTSLPPRESERSKTNPYRPKMNFFITDNPPKFMFAVQLSFLPIQGEMISLDNAKYKVVEVTRVLEYSVDKRFVKETGINVLVTKYAA